MASETFARGDFLANRGTPLIDDTNDLCPNNVGGQIVPFVLSGTYAGTKSAFALKFGESTLTRAVPFKDGSVIGLAVRLSTALTASDTTSTFSVFRGATSTGVSVAIAAGARQGYTAVVKDSGAAAQFSAGNLLTVRLTCSTIASSALTAQATIYAEM